MPYVQAIELIQDEQDQLEHLVKHAKHWRERQRSQTILWLSQGKTVKEIAVLHGVKEETIRTHRRNWRHHKIEAIWEGKRSGHPRILQAVHQAQILSWIDSDTLNSEQIRQRLYEQYQIEICQETLRRFLRASGIVYKRTRHSLKKKRCSERYAQAEQDIAQLRQQAAQGEIILGYVDETGICSTPDNRYAWTIKGQVHQVTAIRSKRVNIIGALLSTGHFVTACLQESVTGEYFYAYVMGVAKQIKEKYNIPLTLIVDNASIHKSKKMQAWRDLLERRNCFHHDRTF